MKMTIRITPNASASPRAAARMPAHLHPHALALACALALAPTLALAQQAGTGDPHAGHAQQTQPEDHAEHGQNAHAAHDDHARHEGHDRHDGHAGHTPPPPQTTAMRHHGDTGHEDHEGHDDTADHGSHHAGHARHATRPAQESHQGQAMHHGDHGDHGDHGRANAESHAGHGAGMPMQRDGDLPADAAPITPIPPITAADRIAAQGPGSHGGMHADGTHESDMHAAHGDNAHDRRIYSFLLFDRLETWDTAPGSGEAWEVAGWVGRDIDKLRVRSEGERKHGHTESADLELLYSRAIAPWWDLTAGVRHDFAPGKSQDWAAIGVIGMAPYKFEVEATAYVGASGRTALRAEAEYSLLLTDRLILQPLVEAEWHGRSDAARGVGAGLGKVETGLRLRYEIRRQFAPYVGIVHERSFGRSADFQREEGEDTRDTRVVFGVRMWF